MAPKEAPKPHPKKHTPPTHPKKHAAPQKHESPGKEGKQLRRCYEHLARVEVLLRAKGGDAKLLRQAGEIRDLALEQLNDAELKAAAELSRAAEHVAFAALVQHEANPMEWGDALEAAFVREYEELRDDADDAEDGGSELGTLLQGLLKEAERARKDENFARAMECVRGAEALADAAKHVLQAA
jgi:hypothetical protein